jgi:hypothetical protein
MMKLISGKENSTLKTKKRKIAGSKNLRACRVPILNIMLERASKRLPLLLPVACQLHRCTYLSSRRRLSGDQESTGEKMQNSLSLVIILRIMIYIVVQFGWGLILTKSRYLDPLFK